jgi:hypothetical protein
MVYEAAVNEFGAVVKDLDLCTFPRARLLSLSLSLSLSLVNHLRIVYRLLFAHLGDILWKSFNLSHLFSDRIRLPGVGLQE